jgi:hypothetical protein
MKVNGNGITPIVIVKTKSDVMASWISFPPVISARSRAVRKIEERIVKSFSGLFSGASVVGALSASDIVP